MLRTGATWSLEMTVLVNFVMHINIQDGRPFSALPFVCCPLATIDYLVTATSSDAPEAGIFETYINCFLETMAKDHTHYMTHMHKPHLTTGWI